MDENLRADAIELHGLDEDIIMAVLVSIINP